MDERLKFVARVLDGEKMAPLEADTVAKWSRVRFRRHWAKISRPQRGPGRPRVDIEARRLIRDLARDGWGAPRIHGELMMLGFDLSERTVSRYIAPTVGA